MIGNVPRHVAVIPDGNRRFAKRLMRKPWKGHEWGFEKIRKLFDWCKELDIRIVTIYALSLENLNSRPKKELGFLLDIARKEIRDVLENRDSFAHKNRVRLSFFGRIDLLPRDLQGDINKAMEITRKYRDYYMNIAIAYGGRQELIDASRKIALDIANGRLSPKQVNELVLRNNLQTNGFPDPDLIIRTGGEKRISNFLLFQGAYSELSFTDTLWPEFGKREFRKIISDFGKRERRFGR